MNDNYPYGGAEEQRRGMRPQGSYGAPDREQEMHRGYHYRNADNQEYGRDRNNEGWRGFIEDQPWRQANRDHNQNYEGGGGYGNQARQGWPSRQGNSGDYRSSGARDGHDHDAGHQGYAYRGAARPGNHDDDYRDESRGYARDDYRGEGGYYGQQASRSQYDGERFGQRSNPSQWGQQGYGQPYSQRDWGTRDYHRESGEWDRQDAGWQNQPQRGAGFYDAGRSSQGNRDYSDFAGGYRGQSPGRQWGAFGGTGWGSTSGDGGTWEGSRTGVHHRGRGPKGYQRADERIKEEICERLTHDPFIDASEITVECKSGTVTLEGHIERRALKHRVEDMVDAVSGVRDVQNRLTVASSSQSMSQPRSGSDSQTGAGAQEQQATSGTTGAPTETRSTQHAASGSTSTGSTTTRQ